MSLAGAKPLPAMEVDHPVRMDFAFLPHDARREGTVIGAGALVTKDCEPGAVCIGVPAQKVR